MSASLTSPPIVLPESTTSWALALVPDPLSDFELRQVAVFLADFLLYDTEVAMQHSASWYRNQVGEDVCSISRAIRLRQFTIEVCSTSDQALGDDSEASTASEVWMAAQIGLKFLLAFVVLAGVWLAVCVTWVEGGSR